MICKKIDMKSFCLKIFILIMVFVSYFGWSLYEKGKPVRLGKVIDGNTISLSNGKIFELLGTDDSELRKEYLTLMLSDRNMWLEKIKEDVQVWVGCEGIPVFSFKKTGEKPFGCKRGILVNEQVAKIDW